MHNLILRFLSVPIKIIIMHNLILGFLNVPKKIIIVDISGVSVSFPVLGRKDLEPVLYN